MERRTIEIERIDIVSAKPFEAVLAALESSIGHPDEARLRQMRAGAGTFAELEQAVRASVSDIGLMLFTKFDLGAVLRKQSGRDTPKMVRLIVGNPLIMTELARHTPQAGSYAPVTILVDERGDGVHLAYDTMASLLAPYGSRESLVVARDLDAKVVSLLRTAASG